MDMDKEFNMIERIKTKCFKKLVIFLQEVLNNFTELKNIVISKNRAYDFSYLEWNEQITEILRFLTPKDIPDNILKEVGVQKFQIREYIVTLRTLFDYLT